MLTVSHNNIHRPSAPEKEVNQKENTLGKIAKKATDDAADFKVYVYSDLGEVLFHYVIFRDKENRDLSSKIYRVFFGGIGITMFIQSWRKVLRNTKKVHIS